MRTISLALLALGFAGAMAVSAPVPAQAQGVYLGGSGVSVQFGERRDRYRNSRRYYRGYDNYYSYDRRPYSQPYYSNGYGYSGYGQGYYVPSDRHTPQ
jgi:hypothetical protein